MRKYTKYISISFISIGLFLPIAVLFYAPTTSEAILWYTSFNVTGNPNIYRNMNVGQVQQLRAVDSSGNFNWIFLLSVIAYLVDNFFIIPHTPININGGKKIKIKKIKYPI